MKLLEKNVVTNQPGNVKMIAEGPDDLWLAYNLIATGDVITAETTRKVYNTSSSAASSVGKKNPFRVKTELEIKITAVDYQKNSSVLRISGKNQRNNEFVKAGMFHTLELEKNKEFNLEKKLWNEEAVNVLKEASSGGSAVVDLSVVLLDDTVANLFLIGKRATALSASVHASETGSNRFFEMVLRAFTKHVDFETIRCVVIGSPGPTKEEFRRYLLSEAQKQKIRSISNNKSRILLLKTNSAEEVSLKEVLENEKVMDVIRDTKSAIELRAFKEFADLMSSDSDRVCYGPKSVETAHELVAVETLLITDDLFKSEEINTRQRYVELVKSVKKAGGRAYVFTPAHLYGKQLSQLTGIAAILRFPLPDLDDIEV